MITAIGDLWDLMKGIFISSNADNQEENLASFFPISNQENVHSLSDKLRINPASASGSAFPVFRRLMQAFLIHKRDKQMKCYWFPVKGTGDNFNAVVNSPLL